MTQLVPHLGVLLNRYLEFSSDMQAKLNLLQNNRREYVTESLVKANYLIQSLEKDQKKQAHSYSQHLTFSFAIHLSQMMLSLGHALACWHHGLALARNGNEQGKRFVKTGLWFFLNTCLMASKAVLLSSRYFKTSGKTRLLRLTLHGAAAGGVHMCNEKIVSSLTKEEKETLFGRYQSSYHTIQIILHIVQIYTQLRQTFLEQEQIYLDQQISHWKESVEFLKSEDKTFQADLDGVSQKMALVTKDINAIFSQVPIPPHLLTPTVQSEMHGGN